MKRIIKWVVDNWSDPVWSKVFAGIILSALGLLSVLFISLFKQIPLEDLYQWAVTTHVQINYLSIIITVIIVLSLLIPAILMGIIRFQLKQIKFPADLKSASFDLQQFLSGQWYLTFTHSQPNLNGSEPVTFLNGNQYYTGQRLVFILTDIEFNEAEKKLKWSKVRYESNQKHSRETLRIENANNIKGSDDLGFDIHYVRMISSE